MQWQPASAGRAGRKQEPAAHMHAAQGTPHLRLLPSTPRDAGHIYEWALRLRLGLPVKSWIEQLALENSTASADHAIKPRNGQQDHGICCDCVRAFYGDGAIARRAVHRYEHAESGGVSAGVLCKQSVLRHIT